MGSFLLGLGYDAWILDVLIVLPLVAALVVALVPVHRAKYVAVAAAAGQFLVSAGLWWTFDVRHGAMQFVVSRPWIPDWGIGYELGLDGISLFMVLLTTFMMPLVILASFNHIKQRERGYYALMLVLETAMIGVFVALDLFLFYVFWEVVLIPMYFLIGVWGGPKRIYAAIKFFIYTFVGSLLMLVAIVVIYNAIGRATGTYSFEYSHILANIGVVRQYAGWLFGAFALAFAIKVPIFPFHTWLPDAHVEAPTGASVILAGILLKMGTYGFLRFALPLFPDVALSAAVANAVVILGVVGIIYGALVAMVQPDFKKLIAYSSVSHLGFVMLGIWAVTVQSIEGAVVIMISHGISTGALFLLAGMLYERSHTREIAAFGGIARVVPLFATVLTVVALSSIGLPGTNGFIGEFLVLVGSFGTYPAATIVATSGVIFAAVYLLWALQRMIFNELDRPENKKLPDLSAREMAVLAPLLACIVWIGVYPAPILRRVEATARALVTQVRGEQVVPRPRIVSAELSE